MPERLHPTNFIVTQAIGFLRRRDPREPFFLYLSFHRPHPPYDPPAWAFARYIRQEMPPPPVGDRVDLYAPYADPHDPTAPVGAIDPRTLQRARAGYFGHMTHIDHQLNRFLEVLQEFGQRQHAYLCFTADHGELMGDHHLFRKSLPDEGSAHIPLILQGPPDGGIVRRREFDPVAELRDVLPTLLDCASLPVPETAEGRSLLPVARGEQVPWRSHLHGEHTALGQSAQHVTDGHEKYVWLSGTGAEQLFNLDDDPQERHDLSRRPGGAERLARWRHVLVQAWQGRPEGFTDGERLLAGRPVTSVLPWATRGRYAAGDRSPRGGDR
jgi:arylsulfatase A-like enzyme